MSSPRSERGQATVEYAGVLLLVGLIVAAMFTLVPSIRGTLEHAVACVIPGDGRGTAGSATSGGDAASSPGSTDGSEPAVPPAAAAAAGAGWTGQAANLPRGGS